MSILSKYVIQLISIKSVNALLIYVWKIAGTLIKIKWHHLIFEMAIFYFKNRFPFVSLSDTDFIIDILKIEFRIDCYPVKTIWCLL
jgi:hypothetical protein